MSIRHYFTVLILYENHGIVKNESCEISIAKSDAFSYHLPDRILNPQGGGGACRIFLFAANKDRFPK